jgi:hypothetical protein
MEPREPPFSDAEKVRCSRKERSCQEDRDSSCQSASISLNTPGLNTSHVSSVASKLTSIPPAQQRFVLAEAIKTSLIPVERVSSMLYEANVQPAWEQMLLPLGTFLFLNPL